MELSPSREYAILPALRPAEPLASKMRPCGVMFLVLLMMVALLLVATASFGPADGIRHERFRRFRRRPRDRAA
jgi:hypothetical protein